MTLCWPLGIGNTHNNISKTSTHTTMFEIFVDKKTHAKTRVFKGKHKMRDRQTDKQIEW